MKILSILVAAAVIALACDQSQVTTDTSAEETQSFSEAADDLASDVAADANAAADEAAAKEREAAAMQEALDAEAPQ